VKKGQRGGPPEKKNSGNCSVGGPFSLYTKRIEDELFGGPTKREPLPIEGRRTSTEKGGKVLYFPPSEGETKRGMGRVGGGYRVGGRGFGEGHGAGW